MVVALALILASVGSYCLVLLHAFRRSLGTGFMVLCIPCYQVYYGFSQFEHPRKGLVLAVWIGAGVLGIVLRALSPQTLGN
jgi:translocator protein